MKYADNLNSRNLGVRDRILGACAPGLPVVWRLVVGPAHPEAIRILSLDSVCNKLVRAGDRPAESDKQMAAENLARLEQA